MNNKLFKQVLRLVLSAGAIYMIWRKVDVDLAWQYMQEVHWGFYLLAFLAFFSSRWFAAERVRSLYKTQSLLLTFWMNLKLHFLATFYNLFIPLVGGEGYKAIWLNTEYNIKYKSLVGAAFLDRLAGLTMLAVLTLITLSTSSLDLGFNKNLGLLLIPLGIATHLFFMKWFFKSYITAWQTISIYSLLIQLLQLCTAFLILKAMGVHDQMNDYLFIFLLSSFAFVLPVIGAREGVFVLGADQMGLDPELSLAVGILFYLITASNSLLGGTFLLFPSWMRRES